MYPATAVPHGGHAMTLRTTLLPRADGAAPHHWMAMNNRAPIAAHMQNLLPPDSPAAQGLALEIGSGTGAQMEALAESFPGISSHAQ